jgi:acyl-coenzyme A thioesterase PaaI-like protein
MDSRPDTEAVGATQFPPARHVLRDLDITSEQVSEVRNVSVAPVGDALRDRAGRPSLGFLSALVDTNAAIVALVAAQPDWTATADLTLHATGSRVVGPVVADTRLARAGSRLVVVRTSVHDARGAQPDAVLDALREDPDGDMPYETAAVGLLSFVRMFASSSAVSGSFDVSSRERRRMAPDVAPPEKTLDERIGLRRVVGDQGVVRLDVIDYLRNSRGALTGGVYGMLFQAAAESAVEGFAATDVEMQFIAQTTDGPVRAAAGVVRRDQSHAVCEVRTTDTGAGDALLCIGTVTLVAP